MSINCYDIKKILQNLMSLKCDETINKNTPKLQEYKLPAILKKYSKHSRV
jgi:hypothetical protein